MRMSLGRVRDIAITVDLSWVVIFVVVTYSLGSGYFGNRSLFPAWNPAMVWSLALLASLLFFASVVAHELAHAVVAQHYGIKVESISLFLFGGVARMRSEPDRPSVEFQVASAGPAASLGLGVLFGTMQWHLGGMHGGNPFAAMAVYLALINAMVAVFNLVPAFPLDGGRVFRALVWWATGSLPRATRVSALLGQGFGLTLIGAGIAASLFIGVFNGVWFILVGWFLADAARGALVQDRSQSALAGVSLSCVLDGETQVLSGDETLQALLEGPLAARSTGPLPVVFDGELIGLIGLPEVRRVPRAQWAHTRARDAMVRVSNYATAEPAHDAWETLLRMYEQNLEWLVVMEDGQFRGAITARRLLRFAGRSRRAAGVNGSMK